MAISVIIPTYKSPEYLDLCLESAIQGQVNKNQIIVVVDGFYDLNEDVLKKYASHLDILNLDENVGMIKAMNLGHYNALHDLVFHVQDDNVFPKNWDVILEKNYKKGCVLTPNQIEPYSSIFKHFHIKDLGRDPNTFDLKQFWEYEKSIPTSSNENAGSTFPFLISKKDYLKVGGLDETYPGPWAVDWEFFLKCELSGLKMVRTYKTHFYHFVSLGTTSTPEEKENKLSKELACHHYFRYKWGTYAEHNPETNSKMLSIYKHGS
jgi:glycosyltransferase involved in cell wall biosynthesis